MILAPPGAPSVLLGSPALCDLLRSTYGEGADAGAVEVREFPGPGRPGVVADTLRAVESASGAMVVGTAAEELLDRLEGPCVDGSPVGLVPMTSEGALRPWLEAVRHRRHPGTGVPEVEILAMWKPFYLEWADRFTTGLRGFAPEGAGRIHGSTADRVDRAELCRRLARGPELAIYLGHGRGRGWSGYRGLRFQHVEAVTAFEPVGFLLSLTCKTFAAERGHVSFGRCWIEAGRACAVLGAVDAVEIEPLEEIAEALLALLCEGRPATVGRLVARLDARLRREGSTDAVRNWSRFRLLGDPGQAIDRFRSFPPPSGLP